jgi:type I restriction enzyme S subunit
MSKQKLIPELRFPEFEEDGEWVEKTLGEVCEMQAGKFVSASEIKDQFNEDLFPCYGGNGLRGYIKSFTHSGTYSLIGRQGALCGNVNLAKDKFHATEHAVVVTPETNVDTIWLYYMLVLLNLNQYATGQAQPGLSVNNLAQAKLNLALNTQEQQKIASCLSSLDEVIAAHSQKLALLKDHKKGLMQNLFPQAGEKVPRYRFKEFEEDGEWVEKTLGEIVNFLSGGTPSKEINEYWNGHIPWISASSMHDPIVVTSELKITDFAVKNGANIVKKGGLLILVRGSMLFKRIPICITATDVSFNQDVKSLELKKEIFNLFLLFLLVSKEAELLGLVSATGIGAGKIDTSDLKSLIIQIPSKSEQQKIASCLSSLDALITAQAEQIAQLKLHKKGLMQGLFPKIKD